MKFASAAAVGSDLPAILQQVADACEQQLDGARPDLVLVFLTSHFEDEAGTIVQTLTRRCPSAVLLGCSAEGVIAQDQEHERVPAVSLMMASLPDVGLTMFRATPEQVGGLTLIHNFVQEIPVAADQEPTFLFLGDPFSVPVNPVLEAFNRAYPDRPLFGGMASGCERPDQAVLLLDDQVHRNGAVGLAMTGPLKVQGVVSQGCRPIGSPFVITRCEGNIIHELGGKPALDRLREVVEDLSPDEARLAQQALFFGRVINEYQEAFSRGDFLIRNLLGIDPRSKAIAVGEEMRVGATIQFHVRDHVSADDDLRQMLTESTTPADEPIGALLFSCNGRGTRMWPDPHHDAAMVRAICGSIPVAGFFAAGELGPIGGRNFIHGHTASIALFRRADG